jgi:hypothetical protein
VVLFLGTTYGCYRAVHKNIALRPEMKVALFASAWGNRVNDLDPKAYPIVVATEQEKRAIARLKRETGRPDAVFLHLADQYVEGVLGGWQEVGVRPVGVMNACDTFAYCGGRFRPELACDVAFVGGYWDYKARNLNRYLMPLTQPAAGLSVRIFGNQPWPTPNYLGLIEERDVRDLFVSATVCPNVSEPHSTDLGWDIIERPFKVLGAGGFCVSDRVLEMDFVFDDDELIRATLPEDWRRQVRHFVNHPEDRLPFIERGRKAVLDRHTYWHRVASLLRAVGLGGEADLVEARYAQVRESL